MSHNRRAVQALLLLGRIEASRMQVGDEPDLRLALPDAFIAYPIHLRERLARIGIRALGGHRAFG